VDDRTPAHERPPAGMPSFADGDLNRSMGSVVSPPRGNKQSSRNTFRELAADDVGHRGRSADDEGRFGRGKSADYDGIGIPRDDAGDRGRARGGGRKDDGAERDRHRDAHREGSRERRAERNGGGLDGGGHDRRGGDDGGAEDNRDGRRGVRSRGRDEDEYLSDDGRREEGRRGRRGASGGDGDDLRQRVADLEKRSACTDTLSYERKWEGGEEGGRDVY